MSKTMVFQKMPHNPQHCMQQHKNLIQKLLRVLCSPTTCITNASFRIGCDVRTCSITLDNDDDDVDEDEDEVEDVDDDE